jgi:hypothetical protein
LFLIAATDPVVAASAGFAPDLIDRLVPLHVEVLLRGVDQARRQSRERLADALELVVALDVDTAIRSDATLAAFVVDRGAPAVVEPVRLAEAGCR